MTKVELEFFTDPDMLKKDTRAGVSDICNRYIKANKYWKSYVPKHESKHIILLDANNLYGYAMSKFLQKIEFEQIFDLKNILAIAQKYVFQKLILNFIKNDYPKAPDKTEIKREMLSDDQWLKQYVEFNTKKEQKQKKW